MVVVGSLLIVNESSNVCRGMLRTGKQGRKRELRFCVTGGAAHFMDWWGLTFGRHGSSRAVKVRGSRRASNFSLDTKLVRDTVCICG